MITNDTKAKYEDAFYDWISENKAEEAWQAIVPTNYHLDDDYQKIMEWYLENLSVEEIEQYWNEFINQLPE